MLHNNIDIINKLKELVKEHPDAKIIGCAHLPIDSYDSYEYYPEINIEYKKLMCVRTKCGLEFFDDSLDFASKYPYETFKPQEYIVITVDNFLYSNTF